MSQATTEELTSSKEVKSLVRSKGEEALFSDENKLKTARKTILQDLPESMKRLQNYRSGDKQNRPLDLTLGEFAKDEWGFSPAEDMTPESFFSALGVDPSGDTVETLFKRSDFPDQFRWLVPEVIREAVRLGLRRAPIYPQLVSAEENVQQPTVTMPHINKSAAAPKRTGETEQVPRGTLSFGQRKVDLTKVGVGMSISDEVQQYVQLNVLQLFLQDVGINLGLALDALALDTLLNGDQDDGSLSAPEIGVEDSASDFQYRDFLRVWYRMSRLGRLPQMMIANEADAIDISQISEFKGLAGLATKQNIDIQTPIPESQRVLIHGNMPSGKAMFVDQNSSLIRLTSQAMMVESDRIVQRQMEETVVTLTTAFANLFRDGRVLMDSGSDFSSWPAYMDVDSAENKSFDK